MARAPRTPGPGRPPGRPRPPSPARIHNDWLRLIEVSGPFLSIPAMIRAFPQGLPRDDATSQLRKDFRVQLEAWEEGGRDSGVHQSFVRFMLEQVLEWPAAQLKSGQALPPGLEHRVAEHGETLRPDLAVVNPAGHTGAGKARVLVMVYPSGQGLERAVEDHRWKASPASRAMELCHAVEVPLALITNGAEWTLVHAKQRETTTYATFNAPLFMEEPGLFNAFRALLGQQRLFGVADADTLEALLAESAANQQEVTDQLGLQVREAVEVLVQAIDRADRNARGAILREVSEKTLYEAAVGVMMRLVFSLAAEERKLLPYGDPLYDAYYSVSTLLAQLQAMADNGEELLERRFSAWARLLASFRAIHGGVDHDRLRLPAYGGSLYDPDRFPFLEGRAPGTRWRETPAKPVQVSDRTVFHLLKALQELEMPVPGGGRETRKLSFRALDVEQIGHVYEGLLDHTAVRANEPMLGLLGAKGEEPEVPLSAIVMAHDRGEGPLFEYLLEKTQKSEASLRKAISSAGNADLQATARLLQACGNDENLRNAVAPWAQLLRTDSSDFPIVIQKGSVFVTAGSDRRSTGTHYTPRSLTEPVVQYALEPQVYRGPAEGWPREKWLLKTPRELLALRVCDMAMGSGAFLAQACRWLGERLVESWEEAEANAGGKLVVTPEGDLATGAPGERPIPKSAEERIALARRAVAERCLYGVDINPMAVEIAKLSLWLVTLQKDRPFTFVDHALRCGDSLLGVTSPEQIAYFHLDPEKGKALHQNLFSWTSACEPALQEAREKRRRLESFTVENARDLEEKGRLLAEAESALAGVRLIADAVVAAALATSEQGADAYSDELVALSLIVAGVFDVKALPENRQAARQQLAVTTEKLMNAGKPARAGQRTPFHWALEFPEVLANESATRGFDTIIGNPPFAGGKKISGVMGTDGRAYCVRYVAAGRRGSADLSAYFLLRAWDILAGSATIGILATNTISEGDTREVALDPICSGSGTIFRAVPSMRWPGEATLQVACVWLRKGGWSGTHTLGAIEVERISPLFEGSSGTPYRLACNAGKCFQGSNVVGAGFFIDNEEAQELLHRDPGSARVLRPVLNGEDLNSRPDQGPSRWVINFQDWPLDRASAFTGYRGPVASDFAECLAVVRERVKPDRDRLGAKADASARGYAKTWWLHGRRAIELYRAIERLPNCFAVARVSKSLAIGVVQASWAFTDAVCVFAMKDLGDFAVLQSSAHEAWVMTYASTLRLDLRYTPTDCFEQFPFPDNSQGASAAARAYLDARASVMRAIGGGLTKATTLQNDPDCRTPTVELLRSSRMSMDAAVTSAYRWTDLNLGHGFHVTKQGVRFTISEAARREVLARLLKLNHERYAEEVKQGLHDEGKKKGKAGKKGGARDGDGGPQGTLF